MAQCTAKSKQSGKRCKRYASPGHTVCMMHGSRTPSGIASATYKTGLYSKSLPARLGSQYQELLNLGNEIFRIDDETAVMTTLIQEQLDRIDEGESAATWKKLRDLYDEMAIVGAIPNKTPADIAEFNNLFARIGRIVNYGAAQWMARAEAVRLIEQKRKLVADERKDQAAKHTAMSFDRVMLFFTAVVSAFKTALEQHISNDDERKLVLRDAQQALNRVVRQ